MFGKKQGGKSLLATMITNLHARFILLCQLIERLDGNDDVDAELDVDGDVQHETHAIEKGKDNFNMFQIYQI